MVATAVCFAVAACPKMNPFMENLLRTVVLLGKVWRLQNVATCTSKRHTVKRGSIILTVYSVDHGVGRRKHQEGAEAEHKRNTV